MKIFVKKVRKEAYIPRWSKNGEWVDLACAENRFLASPQAGILKRETIRGQEVRHRDVSFTQVLVPLGIAMKLPKGFEAIIVPRSSTYKHWGIIQSNSVGVIDNSYCGNQDEWKMPVIALMDTSIDIGDRICQFRIQPSQKASVWTKLRWLFTRKIKFIEVPDLGPKNRGGFGTSGK